ncbi:AAA family ATPase [Campylobacter sp. CNRCH_2016_0050h]|uniref:AAA family ATPase n=1 Tax=Campylobacter sp. CNRCH_2016_0050h TaxID=2911608 RepID=UPI0021E64823|nr:AAA family ATPase [Campylobacter sp. CNRCH_2016_0050h]MCV3456606.1 AAA family ATPase [Campylobacter sp. CNRCH_2016_0050h]
MIDNIKIENYKLIKELEINNVRNINIFTGENNCGKSSILEAIYLALSQDCIKNLIYSYDTFRNFPLNKKNIRYLFNNFDLNKKIFISTRTNKDILSSLKISLEKELVVSILDNLNENEDTKILFEYKHKTKEQKNTLTIKEIKDTERTGVVERRYEAKKYLNKNNSIYLPVNVFSFESIHFLRNIRTDNKEEQLVKYLQIFDKSIKDVEEINGEILIKSSNFNQKVPIKIFGYGFIKFFNYICALISNEANYILIDEIENGLHYKTTKKLIESLIEFNKNTNIQIFISTHSLEFLSIVEKVTNEKEFTDLGIFNIYKYEENVYCKYYQLQQLKELLDNGVELRK